MTIERFNQLYFSEEIKGIARFISTNEKVRFVKSDKYYVLKNNIVCAMNQTFFESSYSDIQKLINKFMWIERKLTVDGIIQYKDKIVLIKRKYPPLGWALPGGMIDPGEKPEISFIREMNEELSINIKDYLFFKLVYANEPRGPIGTYVYTSKTSNLPVAGDDALEIKLINMSDLDKIDFAFEHHLSILKDYNIINE